jgi:hypothetical protein
VRRKMIGCVITNEIGEDLTILAVGVERVPDEGGRRFEQLRRSTVSLNRGACSKECGLFRRSVRPKINLSVVIAMGHSNWRRLLVRSIDFLDLSCGPQRSSKLFFSTELVGRACARWILR